MTSAPHFPLYLCLVLRIFDTLWGRLRLNDASLRVAVSTLVAWLPTVRCGRRNTVEFIIRQMGADPEAADDGGFTPLLNAGDRPPCSYGAKKHFVYGVLSPIGGKMIVAARYLLHCAYIRRVKCVNRKKG